MSTPQNQDFFQSAKKLLKKPLEGPRKIKITVFGPRGVGKTSLLTAMSEQFDKATQKTSLMLRPELKTSLILQDKRADLKGCFNTQNELEVVGGIKGTTEPQDFEFSLAKTGMDATIKLFFIDFPGKDLTSDMESVKKLLDECGIVLVAIDAPALMEEEGRWHDLINKPNLVTDYFKTSYQNLKEPRLVIFVPIKCEKYMRQCPAALLDRVQQGYNSLIEFFDKPNLRSQVVAVITPIQTLGNVEFSRINVKNYNGQAYPHFYFRKTNIAKYNPVDCEQPLRYLLRFLLNIHLEQRFVLWKYFRKALGDIFEDNAFREAVGEFAKNCKTTDGFAVLQDEEGWLSVNK
ncbi:hypothetical protein ACE1B6_20520 [Aerosakkonemataceae cyanobacterium BLCC-F154]|uniref:G domain-containing protein n=1 Tax=Floridaenema fluviatile BLCC-F154 TaxID=3153640 RepID=A0ABV4YFN6_9CYAN